MSFFSLGSVERQDRARFQSVFHSIETPRSGIFQKKLDANPQLIIAIYGAVGLIWSLSLSFVGIESLVRDAPVPQVMNPSLVVLAFGVCLFPLRMILVPIVTFLLSYFASLTLEALLITAQPYGWQLLMVGLITNLFIGTLSGLIAKGFHNGFLLRGKYAPAEVWAAGALAVSVTLFGFIMTASLVDFMSQLTNSPRSQFGYVEIFQHAFRQAIAASGLYLLFLEYPGKRHLREATLFAPIFICKAILTNQGIYLGPVLDPVLIAIALLLVRPTYLAMTSISLGFVVYATLTGQIVVQNPIVTVEDLRAELVSTFAFALMLLLAFARVRSHAMVKRQYETFGRLTRAQKQSKFGYFVVDVEMRIAKLDTVSQEILGSPADLKTGDFVRRVHPDDRAKLSGTADTNSDHQTISLRFNHDGEWTADCEQTIINVYLQYETLWNDRPICYGVLVDVTAEHRQENHLRDVLAELSDRQSRQTQLFSIISHELRTPASMLTMILEEMDEGGTWEELGPQMRSVTDQLMSVLADMRQTVRPEQNLPIHMEPIRPQLLAESVRNTFQIMAKSKGITIDLRMSVEAMQERVTDRVRLTQAISNIVKNAIVHSRATIITIAYREENDGSGPIGHWRIWDNGRNLPEKIRGRLFEAFARDDDAKTRSDGSGLGLFIARSTMRLLGGDIVYIHRTNSGATFEITLPMSVPVTIPESTVAQPEPKEMPMIDVSKMSVLLVEDSHMMGSLMQARLERSFAKVEWVAGGLHAIEAISRNKPDVVLTDLFMPGLGGDELARSLRLQGNTVPIIGMTAADVGEEINRFRASGADEVLTKPVRMDELLRSLERVIKSHHNIPLKAAGE